MTIEISNGDILDKLSILKIKRTHIIDINKVKNINIEYKYIKTISSVLLKNKDVLQLYKKLLNINQKLWNIENSIRLKEAKKEFDSDFISLARSVYITNDNRAIIKKQINILTSSTFVEEKSYEKY